MRAIVVASALVATGCTGATFCTANPFDEMGDAGPSMGDAGAPEVDTPGEAASEATAPDAVADVADPVDASFVADGDQSQEAGQSDSGIAPDAPLPCDRNNPLYRQHTDGWGVTFYDCEMGITKGLALDACAAHFGSASCAAGVTCNLPPRVPEDSSFVCGSSADPDAGGPIAICWGYVGPEGVGGSLGYAYRYDGTLSFVCPHEVSGMTGAMGEYQ